MTSDSSFLGDGCLLTNETSGIPSTSVPVLDFIEVVDRIVSVVVIEVSISEWTVLFGVVLNRDVLTKGTDRVVATKQMRKSMSTFKVKIQCISDVKHLQHSYLSGQHWSFSLGIGTHPSQGTLHS